LKARGVEEKKRKEKENVFYNLEKLISLLALLQLLLCLCFACAVQRRIEKLKLALP
jgi:sulfur relay (sulfurtransferase) complex TusBCD TusD component (DsrE family)